MNLRLHKVIDDFLTHAVNVVAHTFLLLEIKNLLNISNFRIIQI